MRSNEATDGLQVVGRLRELLSVSLMVAVINVVVAWTLSAHGQKSLYSVSYNLAASLAVILGIGCVSAAVVSGIAGLWPGAKANRAWFFSLYLILLLGVFSPHASMITREDSSSILPLLLLTLAGAVLMGVLAVWGKIRVGSGPETISETTVILLPVLSLQILFAAWVMATRVEVLNDASGLPSMAAWVVVTSLGFSVLASVLIVRRLRGRFSSLPLLVLLTTAILTGPLWSQLSGLVSARAADQVRRSSSDRPVHVVLITIDTLRADEILGPVSSRARTPRLDELMSTSTVFTSARSTSPWTRPAIASLLTGLSPLVHGTTKRNSRLPEQVTTLAEFYRNAGFRTAAIGRNGAIGKDLNFGQGFDEYRMHPTSTNLWTPSAGMQALRILGLSQEDPSSMDLAVRASRWLERHHESSFFLWIHFLDPHGPYAPPREFFPAVDQAPARYRHQFSEMGSVRGGYLVLSEQEKKWVRELYRGEVSYVDACVGLVLDTMSQLELLDGAIVALTSDHGEEFFDHEMMGHGHSLYDELLRVPLIIKAPNQTRSRTFTDDVSIESVAPTLLSLSGVEPESYPFQGTSLVERDSRAESGSPQKPLVSTGMLYYEEKLGVVLARKKYITETLVRSPDAHVEIFDLSSDPGETESIAVGTATEVEPMWLAMERHAEESRALQQILGLSDGEDVPLSPEQERELRALGYIQ